MNTSNISKDEQYALSVLRNLKMQNRDITTLSETDKIALYTYYSEEFIQCFTPFEIPTNPSCCNLDHRNRRGRCNEIIDATPR